MVIQSSDVTSPYVGNGASDLTPYKPSILADYPLLVAWRDTSSLSASTITAGGAIANLHVTGPDTSISAIGGDPKYNMPSNAYVKEDGVTPYVAEDGVTFYTQSLPAPGLIRFGIPDSLGLSDGTLIATDTDRSGSGHDMIASGAQRPTYKANIVNGRGAMLFDGSLTFLTCDALGPLLSGTGTPFTFFCAAKFNAFTGNHDYTLFMLANVNSVPIGAVPTMDFFYSSASDSAWLNRRDNSGNIDGIGIWNADNNWHFFVVRFDGTISTIWADGTLLASVSQGVLALTCDSFTLGCHRRIDGNTGIHNGYIEADGLYSRSLTDKEVAALNAWGANRLNVPIYVPLQDAYQISNLSVWHRDDTWNFQAASYGDGGKLFPNSNQWFSRVAEPFVDGGYDATLSNIYWHNYALCGRPCAILDGTASYMQDDSAASLFSGSAKPFTCAGAFRALDVTTSHTIFSLGNSGTATQVCKFWIDGANGLYKLTRTDDSGTTVTLSGGLPDLASHYFEFTFDGANAVLQIDGVQVVGGSLSTGTCTFNQIGLGIDRRSANTQFFNGLLGEIQLYKRALASADLAINNPYLTARWPAQAAPAAMNLNSPFSGTNGTTIQTYVPTAGPTWQVIQGTAQIQSNLLSPNGATFIAFEESGQYNGTLFLDVHVGGSLIDGYDGIGFRINQSFPGSFVMVAIDPATSVFAIMLSDSTLLSQVAVTFAINTTYTIKAVVNGNTVMGTLNGAHSINYSPLTQIYLTKHGIRLSGNYSVGNFLATP